MMGVCGLNSSLQVHGPVEGLCKHIDIFLRSII